MKCNIHRFGTANICLDCGYIKDYNPVPKEDEITKEGWDKYCKIPYPKYC